MPASTIDSTIQGYPDVKHSGMSISPTLQSALAEVIVDLDATRPGMFVLRFVQSLGPDTDTDIGFSVGDAVTISEASTSTELITGEVTSIEADFGNGGQRTTVRGYDKSHRLHRARKYRSFLNVTDSDIVSQLVSESGLTVGDVMTTSNVHTCLVQVNQTDWEFLKWRAEDNGLTLDSSDGKLNFRTQESPGSGATLSVLETLLAFRPRITAPPVDSVLAQAWDEATKQVLSGTGTVSSSQAATLTDTPGALAATIGSVQHLSAIRTADAQGDVTAIAQALADRFADSFVEAEGVAYGDPTLVPGIQITVQDVGTKFNGDYRITAAKHIFNAQHRYNVSMRFSGIRDASLLALTSGKGDGGSRMSRIEGVVPALVTNTNDPELRCRVKIKFPWLGETVETDWARTLQPGAGPDHGAVILPEVNDEVLVAFEQGDFRRPYILGGLYNGTDKPTKAPYAINNGVVNLRGFVSKTGHRLILQDDAPAKQGIHLITGDDQIEIYLNKDDKKITIDCLNGKVEIHGMDDVSIKSDKNINIEATQQLSLKGTQGVTIESSTTASFKATASMSIEGATTSVKADTSLSLDGGAMSELKGGLVKIN